MGVQDSTSPDPAAAGIIDLFIKYPENSLLRGRHRTEEVLRSGYAHLPRSAIHFLRFNESHSIPLKPSETSRDYEKRLRYFLYLLIFQCCWLADIVELLITNHINHFINIMKFNSDQWKRWSRTLYCDLWPQKYRTSISFHILKLLLWNKCGSSAKQRSKSTFDNTSPVLTNDE